MSWSVAPNAGITSAGPGLEARLAPSQGMECRRTAASSAARLSSRNSQNEGGDSGSRREDGRNSSPGMIYYLTSKAAIQAGESAALSRL